MMTRQKHTMLIDFDAGVALPSTGSPHQKDTPRRRNNSEDISLSALTPSIEP